MTVDLPALASLREFRREALKSSDFAAFFQSFEDGKTSQLDLPRYDSRSLEGFSRWIDCNRSWLKILGLRQKRVGKTGAQTYAPEVERLEIVYRTVKKRGTLLLEERLPSKSVLSNLLLETQLLESFALADKGINQAAEALLSYFQKPQVRALMEL